jgi:cell division transport system permease protein
MLTRLIYLLQETLRAIQRGGWMNWAAVSTVTVLLFLFGFSLQANWQVDRLIGQFGSQLEVTAFLNPGVEAQSLIPFVKPFAEVTAIEQVTKEQAWADLSQELKLPDLPTVTTQLNGNPLVDELRVKARSLQDVPTLVKKLQGLRGIETVQYWPEVLQRLDQLSRSLRWLGFVVISLLTLAAIAVITTTIRLIITAHRREIEIMQLVGATSIWIWLPFILQGLLFGTVGGGLAWVLMVVVQQSLSGLLMQQPDFIQFLGSGLQIDAAELLILPLILLSFGGFVGLLGSLFAVRQVVS